MRKLDNIIHTNHAQRFFELSKLVFLSSTFGFGFTHQPDIFNFYHLTKLPAALLQRGYIAGISSSANLLGRIVRWKAGLTGPGACVISSHTGCHGNVDFCFMIQQVTPVFFMYVVLSLVVAMCQKMCLNFDR